MVARFRAEGWRSYEVEADHLAMLTTPKEGADVLLPMRKRLPSSHPDVSIDAVPAL